MRQVRIDGYVLDTLMPDLIGHDRQASAFIVYLHLWNRSFGARARSVRTSHQRISDEVGLSKSAVQAAIRNLLRRRLLRSEHANRTATPEYFVLRPWRHRTRATQPS